MAPCATHLVHLDGHLCSGCCLFSPNGSPQVVLQNTSKELRPLASAREQAPVTASNCPRSSTAATQTVPAADSTGTWPMSLSSRRLHATTEVARREADTASDRLMKAHRAHAWSCLSTRRLSVRHRLPPAHSSSDRQSAQVKPLSVKPPGLTDLDHPHPNPASALCLFMTLSCFQTVTDS